MEEFESLTNEEMATSIRTKIKSIQYNKYNLSLDILAESSLSNPNNNLLDEYQLQLQNLIDKEEALKSELEKLG